MQQAEALRRAAVVTGGSRGIGRAVCVELARAGMDVCVNYAGSAGAAAETVRLCTQAGARAVAVQADVSTAAGCDALFEAALAAFGRVDVLVNNAANVALKDGRVDELTIEIPLRLERQGQVDSG